MDVINETPFPFVEFESRTPTDRFHTLVLQGTFAIARDHLHALTDQPAVRVKNEYCGEPGRSSLTLESALAPYKRATDIHVNAVARAARRAREWPVSLCVGKIVKRLRVRGWHVWRYQDGAWHRTLPEPCREVRICYELAFGGSYEHKGELVRYEENPYGTGWIHDRTPTEHDIAAPQIVADDEPEHEPGGTYRPAGLGPMVGSQEQRTFCSSASAGLACPGYLWGDEQIELSNLGAPGVRRFSLPNVWLNALLDYGDDVVITRILVLNTLHIDVADANPTRHWVLLTWRCVFPADPAPRRVIARATEDAHSENRVGPPQT
ncbi:MAG TPA: DUF2169 domain-containing protein [Polyangiaceae bacterium]|jgi:hypothetical protein|nr:DUF2169 domain-containing protein [Polyangiaceae bacterium]